MGSSWYYGTPDTLEGALQHGLGRGAAWAEQRPGGADAVLACIRRDHRWWWHIDERPVYLARLVRDLAMPVGAVLDLLREEHGDDEDNTVANTLQVLVALGGGGDAVAVEGLRGYVRDGPRWVEALQALAGAWPVELWDDLLPVVGGRLDDAGILWGSRPWTGWGGAGRADRGSRGRAARPAVRDARRHRRGAAGQGPHRDRRGAAARAAAPRPARPAAGAAGDRRRAAGRSGRRPRPSAGGPRRRGAATGPDVGGEVRAAATARLAA